MWLTRAEQKALLIEREQLMQRMVIGREIRPSLTYFKRPGSRVRIKLLRYLDRTTTGRFAAVKKYIAFEDAADALMYRIKYPL